MRPHDWPRAARDAPSSGPAALVTILATEGSAPRGAGTRMVVTAGTVYGSVGGGVLEHRAIDQARRILAHPPGAWRVQDYPLGPLLGQCCGGRVRLLVERLDPADAGWLDVATPGAAITHRFEADRIVRTPGDMGARPGARGPVPAAGFAYAERLDPPGRPLWLFGAGHVGRAVADRVPGLPLRLAWFDTRDEAAAHDGVTLVDPATIETCLDALPPHAAVLILTHDHALDYRLTAAALARPAAFVGLIGSATKRARFLARLERDGVDAAARARLVCPIGVSGIAGKAPAVIATAALAQLLMLGAG